MRIYASGLSALAVMFVINPCVLAQPEIEPVNGRVTIPITLTPNAAVKPASRVYLLPEFRDSIPGNRVQGFLRCFMERASFFSREESERRGKWNAMSLKDLPLDEIKKQFAGKFDVDMWDAAHMSNIDWQMGFLIRRDGWQTRLPDLQKVRALAVALKPQLRVDIAKGNHEAAVAKLRTLFGLAQTIERHPTIIGHLIALTAARIPLDAVEELIQQPGCPSLYWALMDFPVPFISLRPGSEGERMMMLSADFADFKISPDPISDAVIMRKMNYYEELILRESKTQPAQNPSPPVKETPIAIWQAKAKDVAELKAARSRLIQAGLKPEHVNVWSPLHVVLIDDVILYEQLRDEGLKWMNVHFWQAKSGIEVADSAFAAAKEKSPLCSLFAQVTKVRQAQARTDQRIAALQVVEAIRLHAYDHSGSFPATLAEIKLPLPVDPVTGQPFEYSVKDGVATLHGVNATQTIEANNRYYEIRIKK